MKNLTVIILIGALVLTSCNRRPSYTTLSKKAIRLYLKKSLDDPDSYRPVDYEFDTSRTYYKGIRVEHSFRAKNKFGATVLNLYDFNIDSNYQVESVEEIVPGSSY
jgi:hypothetical protein